MHLIRHGQTQDNITGTLAGHQPGKLTEPGVKQAKQTGKRLKHSKYHHAYVSDLGRTRQTFELIAAETEFIKSLKPTFTELLREKCGGVLEGGPLKLWKENADKEGKGIRDYKCDKAESWVDVNRRAEKFLHTLILNHLGQDDSMYSLAKDMGRMAVQDPKPDKDHKADLKVDHKAIKLEQKANDNATKVMAVSHGGFIMEFHNVANLISKGKQPVYSNVAKNCSIHIFRV